MSALSREARSHVWKVAFAHLSKGAADYVQMRENSRGECCEDGTNSMYQCLENYDIMSVLAKVKGCDAHLFT
jgi:hypothetical protein